MFATGAAQVFGVSYSIRCLSYILNSEHTGPSIFQVGGCVDQCV